MVVVNFDQAAHLKRDPDNTFCEARVGMKCSLKDAELIYAAESDSVEEPKLSSGTPCTVD